MSASPHGTSPLATTSPVSSGNPAGFLTQVLRTFIRGNGFYVISMILMVYGCHRLVRTVVISGAEAEFARTALSLAVLQAYEFLVIATAVMVVRRLRILGDAGTLLLIESALLLDPTFFANSFLTMPSGRGVAVNAACLILVPAKLALLQAFLRIRLSPRAWGAFLLTAALIYLAPWPLDRQNMPFLTLYGFYYALGAMIFCIALLLPPASEAVGFSASRDSIDPTLPPFASPPQRQWIPRILLGLPILIAGAHYIETARVYTLAFYPANAAPLLLAGAILLITNGRRAHQTAGRRLAVDLLAALALLLSVPPFNLPSKYEMQRPVWALPEFIASTTPLICAGVGMIVVYVYAWLWLHDRAALRRLAVVAMAGGLYGFWKTGAPGAVARVAQGTLNTVGGAIAAVFSAIGSAIGWIFSQLFGAIRWVAISVAEYPDAVLLALLALAIWLAWRYSRLATWFVAGFLGITIVFRHVPGATVVEFLESVIMLGLILSHRFRPDTERGQRLAAAVLVCFVASLRLHVSPSTLTATFVGFQILLLTAGTYVYGQRTYGVLAGVQMLSTAMLVGQSAQIHIPGAVLAIIAGLALFAMAVYVTFNKQQLLERLETGPGAMPESAPQPPLADDELSAPPTEGPDTSSS